MKDNFAKVEAIALRSGDEQKLDTIRFFRNSALIHERFSDWKDIDRFYFIPLSLEMSYHIAGHTVSMADGEVFLGSFIRTNLEHPELFSFVCPDCGKVIRPYGYNGSPLSGRVDLQGSCSCGWDGYVSVKGWRERSDALKATQKKDSLRHLKSRVLHQGIASVAELLEFLQK